ANYYGITGMATGTASTAIKQCFDDWLDREGTGNREDRIIIEQTEAFMQQNAGSYRFIHWDDKASCTDNLAGYRKYLGNELSDSILQEYWIIPTVFKDEICKTYDVKKTCDVLAAIGWLSKHQNRYQKQRKGKGRFYVLIGETNPQDSQDDDDYESCPFK
nr:hypothetical protein [Gammaproteobacteria bacterium]